MRKLLLVLFTALLPLASANAALFKCVEDGRVTYQAHKCSGEGKQINVVPPEDGKSFEQGSPTDPREITNRFEEQSKTFALEQKVRDLDYKIRRQEEEISKYQADMKTELDALQEQKNFWEKQLGGNLRAQGIADEMKTSAEAYRTKIQAAQDELAKLNTERSALGTQIQRSETATPPPQE